MQLSQMTDAQLNDELDEISAELLATYREEQPFFDRLNDAYDSFVAELKSRGRW